MAKKKSRLKYPTKGKKIHPLIKMLMGLFALVIVGVLVTANAYKNVSPLQQVAGAEDSTISGTPTPHITFPPRPSTTPTQSCLVMLSVRGISPCGKDSYKGIAAICGDSSQAKISPDGQCRSLTAWFTKLAQACTSHSSCKVTGTPTPKVTGTNEFHPSGQPRISQRPPRPTSTESH